MKRNSAVFLACAIAMASGCGGGGGGSSTGGGAGSVSTYFPIDANSRWLYTETANVMTSGGPSVVAVVGTQSVNSQTGRVFQSTDVSSNTTTSSIYTTEPDGVWQYASSLSDPLGARIGPVKILPNPIADGASYIQIDATVDSGIDYDFDGKNDPITFHTEVTVVSTRETQTVPAGTFASCLHLQTSISETVNLTSGGTFSATGIEDDWYAPSVGLVRSAVTPTSANGLTPSSRVLAEYRLNSSSSAAPSVSAVTPASGVARGATLSVTTVFDRIMSAASLTQSGSFTVTDSSNTSVPGTVSLSGDTLTFIPNQIWASGSYTATVSTAATDAVGNPLPVAKTWSFDVDAVAPSVVSSVPLSYAVNVPLTSTISFQMSEPLNPASVNANSIWLYDSTYQHVTGTTTLSVDATTLTFTPSAPLLRRANYTAVIDNSVTDAAGNPAFGNIQFRTEQGRFAEPSVLTSSPYVIKSVVADVNRDGNNDVVFSMSAFGAPAGIMYGQAGGTLSAPVVLTGGPPGSSFDAIAVGDVNGDGTPDVVVGADNHGMQIFSQDGQGNFTQGDFLARVYARVLRIADIDGDGKNELIVASMINPAVDIWHQDANGHLQLQASLNYGLSGVGAYGMEIGDVNGDGQIDIAVTLTGGVQGKSVALFLSQGAGAFAPAQFLDTGSTWGPYGVAIGDINGDGRNDIVVSAGGNTPTFIYAYYQSVTGTLSAANPIPTYEVPDAVRIADLNGDGRADIAVAHGTWDAFGVYLQQADGTLAPEVLYDAPYVSLGADGMSIGDINHDFAPDILLGDNVALQNLVPNTQMAVGIKRPGLSVMR